MTEAKIIKTIARQLWKNDCAEGDREYRIEKRSTPAAWADPWAAHGGGIRQAQGYEAAARLILDAIREHVTIEKETQG